MSVLLWVPIAFITFLAITYLVYRVGKAWAPRTKPEGGKVATYACGEDIPGAKIQYSYPLFHFALLFTILHVAALVIATVPSGTIAILALVYLITAIIAVVITLAD